MRWNSLVVSESLMRRARIIDGSPHCLSPPYGWNARSVSPVAVTAAVHGTGPLRPGMVLRRSDSLIAAEGRQNKSS